MSKWRNESYVSTVSEWVNEQAHINLKNEKSLVDRVSGHDGEFSVIVGDFVSPVVHLYLTQLLQMQQQLKLVGVVLPAQGTFQQDLSEQTKGKETHYVALYIS